MIVNLIDQGNLPALVDTLSFHEARLRIVAENVANLHTPGYRARRLDAKNFQQALRKAIDRQMENPRSPWRIDGGEQVRTSADGGLLVRPELAPPENLLFHDGTNLSIERQMAEAAKIGIAYDLTAQLLRSKFAQLRKAIRGQS